MNASEIIIRITDPDDAAKLRELRLEALRLHPTAFGADLAENEARPMEWWRELSSRPGDGPSVMFVAATLDGELAGMAGVSGANAPKQAHPAWIWGVYVRPVWRAQRLCARLLDACIAWARAKRLKLLMIDVTIGNDPARRCYEHAGFTVYGVQPMVVQVDGVFHDELLMALRL